MHVKTTKHSDTSLTLTISADESFLKPLKHHVLEKLGAKTKVPGFRHGKAPAALLERQLDPATLQTEFLEEAVSHMYLDTVDQQRLRPVSRPEITLKKFVPFTEVEFDAQIEVIGDVMLPDYKKIKLAQPIVTITEKDIKEVLASLQKRLADKKSVERSAQAGDEVTIDFNGTDDKGQSVKGAEGKDYPLVLGSDSFIPGFEANIIGLKPGDSKTFSLTFPKDYGLKALANRKVRFEVKVIKVHETTKPKVDDAFAAKAGPFKTVAELKSDIKKQLKQERQFEADQKYEDDLVRKVVMKSKVALPKHLIDEQIERQIQEVRQNLTYRGQTYQEYLDAEQTTDEKFRREIMAPVAEERVKAGVVLTEIAEKEQLQVTAEEIDTRLQLLKAQYKDQAMLAELEKPEARRDITSRLLTEKTVAKLVNSASK